MGWRGGVVAGNGWRRGLRTRQHTQKNHGYQGNTPRSKFAHFRDKLLFLNEFFVSSVVQGSSEKTNLKSMHIAGRDFHGGSE